jgi:hypothetical protein
MLDAKFWNKTAKSQRPGYSENFKDDPVETMIGVLSNLVEWWAESSEFNLVYKSYRWLDLDRGQRNQVIAAFVAEGYEVTESQDCTTLTISWENIS